jgi:hypothetical protein
MRRTFFCSRWFAVAAVCSLCLMIGPANAEWSLDSPSWYGDTDKEPTDLPAEAYTSSLSTDQSHAAPEPGTLLLFLVALLTIATFAARNFRARAPQPARIAVPRSGRR